MLKPDRHFNPADSECSYYMGVVANQGILVAYSTGDSLPPALDDANGYAHVPLTTDAKPIGILLDNVVNKDLTDTYLNRSRREVQINNKVEIVREGWFVTDRLVAGINPSPGDDMYFAVGGLFATATGNQLIGTFESTVDGDGYCRIRLKIR